MEMTEEMYELMADHKVPHTVITQKTGLDLETVRAMRTEIFSKNDKKKLPHWALRRHPDAATISPEERERRAGRPWQHRHISPKQLRDTSKSDHDLARENSVPISAIRDMRRRMGIDMPGARNDRWTRDEISLLSLCVTNEDLSCVIGRTVCAIRNKRELENLSGRNFTCERDTAALQSLFDITIDAATVAETLSVSVDYVVQLRASNA